MAAASGLQYRSATQNYFLIHHHIDRNTNPQFRQHIENFVEHGIHRAQNRIAAIGAGKAKQAAEGVHGGVRKKNKSKPQEPLVWSR